MNSQPNVDKVATYNKSAVFQHICEGHEVLLGAAKSEQLSFWAALAKEGMAAPVNAIVGKPN